jgi:transposase-like protein
MKKIAKQAYTTEFKALSVRRITDGQSIPATAREWGISDSLKTHWQFSMSDVV